MALVVQATAPVRVCDVGGWTDTWFAGYGRVLNVAVGPAVDVRVEAVPGRPMVTLDVRDFAEEYTIIPGERRRPKHALLEAAVDECPPPPDVQIRVRVSSRVPPGAGTGTSAAVAVALVGALEAMHSRAIGPGDAAAAAHRLEVERLRLQSGIQDQISAAYGGVNFIEMSRYPDSSVTPVALSAGVTEALDRRLLVIYLGRSHVSSAVHDDVIASLQADGGDRLRPLREAATAAWDALRAGDLEGLGQALLANTAAQARLHPSLVGPQARRIFEVARRLGAAGWKVNGAGGAGGSVTLLAGAGAGDPDADTVRLARAVVAMDPTCSVLPLRLSPTGLTVTMPPGGGDLSRDARRLTREDEGT